MEEQRQVHQDFSHPNGKPYLALSFTPESILSLKNSSQGIPTLKTYRNAVIKRIETAYLKYLIQHSKGDLEEVAGVSGISKNRLYFLIRKYNLKSR